MLEQEYKTLYNNASIIKNWQTMNKNDLINAYIDNEKDENLRSAYFSAIMCRYWGNIGKYYTSSKASGFTIEDCYSWLVEAIMIGLKYRKWRDSNNQLSKDKNAPDKVINRCIFSRRRYYYYISNLKKNKGEYNKVSLDDSNVISSKNNKYLIDTSFTPYSTMDIFYEVLRDFFIKKEYLKGIVFYNLVNNFDECINNNKINIRKVTNCVLATDYVCLSKELKIGKDYLSLIDEIKSMKHDKLFKLVKKVVSSFSNDKKLEEKLCY